MEFAKNITRVSALALGIAGVLAFGDVHAAAFQLKENSVKAQGRAMAGAASSKGDASVVVNNPAVMSTFTERTLQTDITAIDLSYEFNGSGTAAPVPAAAPKSPVWWCARPWKRCSRSKSRRAKSPTSSASSTTLPSRPTSWR